MKRSLYGGTWANGVAPSGIRAFVSGSREQVQLPSTGYPLFCPVGFRLVRGDFFAPYGSRRHAFGFFWNRGLPVLGDSWVKHNDVRFEGFRLVRKELS